MEDNRRRGASASLRHFALSCLPGQEDKTKEDPPRRNRRAFSNCRSQPRRAARRRSAAPPSVAPPPGLAPRPLGAAPRWLAPRGRLAAAGVGGGEDRREASCPRARARPSAAVRDPLARWPPCRRYRRHPRSPFSRSSQHLPRAATETKAGGNGSARGKGGGEQVPAFGGG